MKKLREAERKERRDRRVAAQKECRISAARPRRHPRRSPHLLPRLLLLPLHLPMHPSLLLPMLLVDNGGSTPPNVSRQALLLPPSPTRRLRRLRSALLTPIKPYVMSPPSIISPEREAELDATEDAALQRAKKRADERRAKKYARINDPNISAEERARLQGELSRENSQKLTEMSKLKAEHDEDHQLFSQLESSLRRVMSSKGPAGDEVLARAAEAEEVSDWIEQSGDAEALPANISQKLLARNVSRSAVEAAAQEQRRQRGRRARPRAPPRRPPPRSRATAST
jgi:hypothetical protein